MQAISHGVVDQVGCHLWSVGFLLAVPVTMELVVMSLSLGFIHAANIHGCKTSCRPAI